MPIQDHKTRQLLQEIAQELVVRTAPEESEIFEELAEEYFADPSPPDLGKRPGNTSTGFGPDDVLAAVTPAAIAMTSVSLTGLFGSFAKGWSRPESISAEQRDKVAELAYEAAVHYGMDSEKATDMVNALFVALVREPGL